MKIAFIYANKLRHVIVVTKDKKMQQLAEQQKMICVDYEGLVNFFEEQQTRKRKENL
jgi:hypothetical protein